MFNQHKFVLKNVLDIINICMYYYQGAKMRNIVTILLSFLFLIINPLFAGYDDSFYDFRGFNPIRESHPYEPEEYLDPFTGNFTLIYTDIYLPGNGGLDLKIMRVYNSNIYRDWEQPQIQPVPDSWMGFGWSLHMGRLVCPLDENKYLEMPDGSKHCFYQDINDPTQWISKDYWLLKQSESEYEVLFTDGVKWKFSMLVYGSIPEPGGPVLYYPTVKISDPSGINNIIINYQAMPNNETAITQITDACGRSVNFIYEDAAGQYNLDKIVVNSKVYDYVYDNAHYAGYSRLRAVKFPGDPVGYYTYEYYYRDEWPYDEMTARKNPWSGIFNYNYDYHTFNIGGQIYTFRVLTQRSTASSVWTISYANAYSNEDSTYIATPYNEIIYKMYGYNMEPLSGMNWMIGLVLSKKITNYGGACPLWVQWTYNYEPSPPISNDDYYGPINYDDQVYVPQLTYKKIQEHSISDDNWAYTTNYDTYYQNYEYGHPTTILENSGDSEGESPETRGTKTTHREYWYNFAKNIIDKIDMEEVYYSDVTTPHHIEDYSYYPETGKLQSKTIDGVTTSYIYDLNNNLRRVTDANGRYIEYQLYTYGVPRRIYNMIYTITRAINWEGTIAWERNGRGYTTEYQYDGRNRLTLIDPPVGNSTTIQYATDNKWKKTILGSGWTKEYFDDYGRIDYRENSLGIKVDYSYNPYGWLTYKSFPFDAPHPNQGIYYEYDYLGRIASKNYPGFWTETFYHYNPGTPVVVYKDRTAWEGHQVRLVYRVFGNPFNNPLLLTVIYKYNNNSMDIYYTYNNNADKLTQILTAGGIPPYIRTFNYDPTRIGLLQNESSPERGTISYTYENNGNLKTRTDASGNVVIYSYDNANRLINIDYPGTEYDVTNIYDNADNLRHITTPTVDRGYAFDAMNRVTRDTLKIDGRTFVVSYQYDANGNLEYITYPDNASVQYIYDAENRVLKIPGYIDYNITYHPSGRESYFKTYNNCETSITYDDMDRVQRIQVIPDIMDEEYSYDQEDNLISLTDHLNVNNNQTFSYDDFHRLTAFNAPNLWGAGLYGYEQLCFGRRIYENINGVYTNYTYNATTKRLDNTSGSYNYVFTYDDNGNITSVTGDKELIIKYDYENKPVRITNSATVKEVRYAYDGQGTRVKRITPYEEPGPAGLTTFYYYMTAPWGGTLYELRADISSKSKYVFLNGKILSKVDNSGNKYFYHNDYLGTVKKITDASQRKVYEWLGYPFGKEYWLSVGIDNYYRFTQKEFDKFNDLYYYGVRYYFPDVGIFITPEPVIGTDNLNLQDALTLKYYNYCRNNPLRFIDPDGERMMAPDELAVVREILTKVEQSYFTAVGESEKNLLDTSWPDKEYPNIKPVSLQGLPGKLSPRFYRELFWQRLKSLFEESNPSGTSGFLPNSMDVLVYDDQNERLMVYPKMQYADIGIVMIVSEESGLKGEGGGVIKYYGSQLPSGNRPPLIVRYLSPNLFNEWKKRIEGIKKRE